jgi:hypothetical protein
MCSNTIRSSIAANSWQHATCTGQNIEAATQRVEYTARGYGPAQMSGPGRATYQIWVRVQQASPPIQLRRHTPQDVKARHFQIRRGSD